jgi:predicted nucleic acid-binding protein
MYDTGVKSTLIRDLVAEVFNTAEESTIDGQIIAEYITNMGRDHGSSNEQTFFGRATLQREFKVKKEDKDEQHKPSTNTSKFVYTGATVRSLE